MSFVIGLKTNTHSQRQQQIHIYDDFLTACAYRHKFRARNKWLKLENKCYLLDNTSAFVYRCMLSYMYMRRKCLPA